MLKFSSKNSRVLLVYSSLGTNSLIAVRVGGTLSDWFCQSEGVPQGSILSVTCFLLVMNSVSQYIPFPTWQFHYVMISPSLSRSLACPPFSACCNLLLMQLWLGLPNVVFVSPILKWWLFIFLGFLVCTAPRPWSSSLWPQDFLRNQGKVSGSYFWLQAYLVVSYSLSSFQVFEGLEPVKDPHPYYLSS